jgi:hypothetical protein
MRSALLIAILAASCSTSHVGAVMGQGTPTGIGAAVTTAAAAGTSLYSRSQGGCYAVCQAWEQCNGNTGLCESLPCNNSCAPDERCDRSGAFGDRCVKGDAVLTARAKAEAAKSSVLPDVKIENKPQVPDAAKP